MSVYYPFIKLESLKSASIKTKKYIKPRSALLRNELKVSAIIRGIPFFLKRFLPILTEDELFLSAMSEHTTDFIRMKRLSESDSESFVVITKMDIPQNDDLYTFPSSKKTITNLLFSLTYLLESIKLLRDNHIVHMNISQNSIIYNGFGVPLIQEFQTSIDMNSSIQERKQCITLFHTIPSIYLPLEVHALQFIYRKKLHSLSHKNIEDISDEFLQLWTAASLSWSSESLLKGLKDAAVATLRPCINKSIDYITLHLFATYKTWDHYSLSFLFIEIIQGHFMSSFKDGVLSLLHELLIKNIQSESKKRNTIEETMEGLNYLMYCTDGDLFIS